MTLKVYELASILGLTNDQMIEVLWEHNIKVENHMSIVDNKVQKQIVQELMPQANSTSHRNKSSLKFVEIKGLFYKYDYVINLENDINIFIAENGFGKTTILNIIIATLKQDREKLRKLPFKSIILGIGETKVEISKEDLKKVDDKYLLEEIKGHVPASVYRRMLHNYKRNRELDIDEINYWSRNISLNNMNERYYVADVDHINIEKEAELRLDRSFKKIENMIKEEVLDFPTYRRIEEELESFVKLTKEERMQFKSKLDRSTINFGIEDVETIIKQLTDKLKQDAINHYSKMNGEVLDDLLSNKAELNYKEKKEIDLEKIKIVIGRIGESRIKELDKLISFLEDDSEVENKNFLEYYLFKLINIYESQKSIDEKIKKYRDVCNGYLVNKEIIYDEVIAEVKIRDKEDGEEINFSELSSGEKQILSLFSRLYLNASRPAIFIIDEPELSLSMVWQKKLLEDIYASGRISLMLVTTHSPFIFKNNFRTFAKELKAFRKEGNMNG
ncbi:AAA family ATPase [Bacillus mycoides]|uniref:AAA family ATPase n=1 Tax=Bacillus mycoides TaxID=1405 RepID=UPI001F148646|nr:AAA family ATPase [Bacillus mycoides]